MEVKYPHEDMLLSELVERLRRQGAVWFNNRDYLLLEELIRRAERACVERACDGTKGVSGL